MIETATVVNHAINKLLVTLDELGMVTALNDGLSIAWAVVEHLRKVNNCRAIFAIQCHELCVLEESSQCLNVTI